MKKLITLIVGVIMSMTVVEAIEYQNVPPEPEVIIPFEFQVKAIATAELKEWEKFRSKAYYPTKYDNLTIGWGFTAVREVSFVKYETLAAFNKAAKQYTNGKWYVWGDNGINTKITMNNAVKLLKGKKIKLSEFSKQTMTEAEANAHLAELVDKVYRVVEKNVKVDLTAHQAAALVVFAYNTGVYGFKTSTLLKELNKGNYDKVPSELRKWVWETYYDNGVKKKRKSTGLIRRREAEVKMWNTTD